MLAGEQIPFGSTLSERQGALYRFGPFELNAVSQRLTREGVPLRLGSRATEILTLLLERQGEVVSNQDIMKRVWPTTYVEDANIRVHVSALRRALGAGAGIQNISGQGYRFIDPVASVEVTTPAALPEAVAPMPARLPAPLARLLGRQSDVERVVDLLLRRRLVTVIGPGGIGKTSLALEASHRLARRYAEGVCFVDLAPVPDGGAVFTAAAGALCPGTAPPADLAALRQEISPREMLVVLDNCEHVVDDAALLAEALLSAAPGVSVLATSRETLRVEGEWLHRLGPLAAPAATDTAEPEPARSFPAVELFLERAAAAGARLEPQDHGAAAAICRQLDGVPLAIELAAARVPAFGVGTLGALLNDHLGLLTGGRRVAAARHRTLQATLDWSYDLLTAGEQSMLRALSVFRGAFTLEEAAAVAAISELPLGKAADELESLSSKSLLSVQLDEDKVTFRMLDTTRRDALRRLRAAGEAPAVFRRHALQLRQGIAALSGAEVRRRIDDLRIALNWCLGRSADGEGDVPLGLALTLAAAPAFYGLSLMAEYRDHAERATAALPGSNHDPRDEMALLVALGPAIYNTEGPVPKARQAFERALHLAERQGDIPIQLRALWGIWLCLYGHARYGEAIAIADEFARRARPGDDPTMMAQRISNLAHLYSGDTRRSLALSDEVLRQAVPETGHGPSGFQYEQRAVAGAMRARALWLMGAPGEALRQADISLAEAVAGAHALSICFVLTHAACPISFWAGDEAAAARHTAHLLDISSSQGLTHWKRSGLVFQAALEARDGRRPLAARDPLPGPDWGIGHLECIVTLDLGVLPWRLMMPARRRSPVWCTAEVLRVRAMTLLAGGPAAARRGEALLIRAVEMAREQGLLAWEIRAATDLALLRGGQGRDAEARALLAAVLPRYQDNGPSPDRQRAEALLAAWHNPDRAHPGAPTEDHGP